MFFKYTEAFVAIAAIDFEALVQFYRRLLERDPKPYIPNGYAEFQLTGLRLGIFCPKESHQQEFANSVGSGMSLCLEVEDLESAIAHLTEIGYPPPGAITIASHGREIYTYDPAGNRLILHQSS
ncbi:MAG: VOC family protein [Hydrococcus sp. C42_A2020_068]|nr:VOC family protein [Hydrococcus sp. C42_A2020_068]